MKPSLIKWCNEACRAHWATPYGVHYRDSHSPTDERVLLTWLETQDALISHGRLAALDYPANEHRASKIVVR